MARSTIARSVTVVRQRYYWPDLQLNFWILTALAAASIVLGINAQFLVIQKQMRLGIPWIFPYGITVGALTIIFILILLLLIMQRRLLPGLVLLGAFILLVLYIVGAIETGIQLFGAGNVSSACQNSVVNNQSTGVSVNTLAWLEQNSICQSWDAVFAFWIIGAVWFIWIIVIAAQVSRSQYDY
ncbi:hypothetical protein EV356DRAFT_574233 [Viridothelium virens]|uniref:MARVEL domain-containing protein n=1 Tax=Viridothelium virens TaxID=1048519 RepID=A0A6A6HHY0_VIRVR|nr:hypothetical protein EV356DRAFT_574233 [Viridothelium virens]